MDEITRVDPLDVDLDLADRPAADRRRVAGPRRARDPPTQRAWTRLTYLQHGNERATGRRPVGRPQRRRGGRLGAGRPPLAGQPGDGRRARGRAPGPRRRGIGGRLLDEAVGFAAEQGRTRRPLRRVRRHRRRRLPGAARVHRKGSTSMRSAGSTCTRGAGTGCTTRPPLSPSDYELVHVVGPTPDALLDGMVSLHEALNDAPADEGTSRRVGRRPGPVVRRADDEAPADDVPRAGAPRPDRRAGRA